MTASSHKATDLMHAAQTTNKLNINNFTIINTAKYLCYFGKYFTV